MAHNLDDRQERATITNENDDEYNATHIVNPRAVAKKYKNLGWLQQRSSTNQEK